ncbi:hypothetical protein ACFL0W_03135 [Nanoarchaeota archaeon]
MDGLYNHIYEWLKERNYDITESKHRHKKDHADRAEIEIYWDCWLRVDDYIRYWVHLKFHIWDFKEVEVVKAGKKVKLCEGRMFISMWAETEIDYMNNWKTRFHRVLLEFYQKYIVNKEFESHHHDANYYVVMKLHTSIRRFLDMEAKSDVFMDMA